MSAFEIPGYTIIKPIDSGGMATVYLAEQKSLGRQVAIKIMAEHLNRDQSFAERFAQEAKIASHLNHPNIVTIYDYGVINSTHHGSTLYLVMAFVEGQDLKSLQPKLTLVARLKIIQDIANALHYAHEQGVIHRDIKPQNILVDRQTERAYLTDFGVAKARQSRAELTQTGMTLGTPHYMSPEQALGKPLDSRADIYSLGVVLYFLLTGHVPYDGESEVAIGLKHFTDPIPRLPRLFDCFQPVLDKALAKQADDRYQTAGEFAEAVGRVSIGNLAALVQSLQDESEAKTQIQTQLNPRLAPAQTRAAPSGKSLPVWLLSALITLGIAGLLGAGLYAWNQTTDQAPPPNMPYDQFAADAPNYPQDSAPRAKPEAPSTWREADETATPPQGNGELNCSYRLINDWGSGWQAEIELTNASGSELRDWQVALTLPSGTEITNAFVSRVRFDGREHRLSPHDWNRTIRPGERIQLGFQGTGQGADQPQELDCSLR